MYVDKSEVFLIESRLALFSFDNQVAWLMRNFSESDWFHEGNQISISNFQCSNLLGACYVQQEGIFFLFSFEQC